MEARQARTANVRLLYNLLMGHENIVHAIGYCRVSTEEQAASGLGLADQRLRIEQEAQRRGWHLTYWSDDGFSAKNMNRPAIAGALEALAVGEAQVLVVAKLDRLSRSLIDFATVMDRAHREGWELVALDLGVDTTTPAGSLMANVMASFAQYERQLISQRTKSALAQARARGTRLGRPRVMPPYVVDRILADRARGRSYQRIAEGLNTEAVPTAQGGVRWYASTVRAVALASDQAA